MRILVISPIATHPQSAGHRSRIFFLTKALCELGHDVHFLYLRTPRQAEDDCLSSMQEAWRQFVWLDYAEGANARRESGVLSLGQIRTVDGWFDDALETPLRRHFESIRPQAVIVMYASISKVLEYFSFPVQKILDTHDVHADRNERLLSHNISAANGCSFTAEEEAKALLRANLILAIQCEDAAHFKRITSRPVLELGLWTPSRNVFSLSADSHAAFFSSANEVGLANFRLLSGQVWPRVLERKPGARLMVAGNICRLIEAKSPSLSLEGYKEDLGAFLRTARLVVSSEVFATGISTKNLTALGFGMPLVTSPAGSRGLKNAGAFLIGRSPAELADHIVAVFEDSSLAARLSNQASLFIEQKNAAYLNTLKLLFV